MTRHYSNRVVLAVSLAILSGTSCRGDARPAADSPVVQAQGVAPVAGHYSAQDFARLRWLAGSWRGRLPDGGSFHERYEVVDDSTIIMRGFPDSLFTRATDSSRFALRGDSVIDEGGSSRWVATALDSIGVTFASARDASNTFAFARESPDSWTATLRSTNREGKVQTTVYQMERVRSP